MDTAVSGTCWSLVVVGAVFIRGAGWYSMCSKAGWGGSRARRRVRSMKGGMVRSRPRAMSDQVLMKCSPDAPSAAWCCIPTPSDTPPHLKYVTCIIISKFKLLINYTVYINIIIKVNA
ncbi:hypothetical protein Hanom_Chr09g00830571 [Helianthus anomalus]